MLTDVYLRSLTDAELTAELNRRLQMPGCRCRKWSAYVQFGVIKCAGCYRPTDECRCL